MIESSAYHAPALLEEVRSLIPHTAGGVYLDGTLGGGGHFRAMAGKLDSTATLIGIDRDKEAIEWNLAHPPASRARIIIEQGRFSMFDRTLQKHGIPQLNGILLDLGVSSHQIDSAGRGFSYLHEGDLDMRMDPDAGIPASAFIRTATESELAKVLRDYGEVDGAERIAGAIKAEAMRHPIVTSIDLREAVSKALSGNLSIKLLAKIFQALRIAVNDELGELKRFLGKVLDFLSPGGRLAVISYHSLEDRMVKEYMREHERICICPPEAPRCTCSRDPLFKRITKKAIKASEQEIAMNRRSRSARLRVVERTAATR